MIQKTFLGKACGFMLYRKAEDGNCAFYLTCTGFPYEPAQIHNREMDGYCMERWEFKQNIGSLLSLLLKW